MSDKQAARAVRKVRRLVRRSGQRPADGIRRALARRAWKRLARAGSRWTAGPRNIAYYQVLGEWAAAGTPDDERRALLAAWAGGETPFIDSVTSMATDPRYGQRGPLAAFCVRHGLAPADPAERVRFLALTGQHEQRRALDPNGTLLAAAYRADDAGLRAALREALASDGDLDVVRVVAGEDRGPAEMTAQEREYVTDQLAQHGDWAALWRLARGQPVCDAVVTLRRIDPRWRPDGQRDRELFSLLAQADPTAVLRARDALGPEGLIRIAVPGLVRAGALSPDGRRLAVWTYNKPPSPRAIRGGPQHMGSIGVYALPDGKRIASHSAAIWEGASLVYCGETLFALASRWRSPDHDSGATIYRCQDGQPLRAGFATDHHIAAITASRQGLVTLDWDWLLTFHDGNGAPVTTVPFTDFSPHGSYHLDKAAPLATDYETGRTAVLYSNRLTVVAPRGTLRGHDPQPEVIARLPHILFMSNLGFRDMDHLLVATDRAIHQWNISGPQARDWTAYPMYGDAALDVEDARDLVPVRAGDQVCFRTKSGSVRYLDSRLELITGRHYLNGRTGTALFGSADGTRHALGGDGFVDVAVREAAELWRVGGLPSQAWTPAALSAVAGTEWLPRLLPDTRPFYDLLVACLQFRLGGEVAIGRGNPDIGDDEIGISH